VTNIRNVDLNLLVALDALYDERSVTRVAERLALSQPTVSGMLKRLRHIFEDDLYIRTSHGVIPTPRAEALAKPIREIIDAARGLLVQEEFDPSVAEFSVNLCGTDYIQNTILTDFAADILMAAPNAEVSIKSRPVSNLESQLSRGEFDFVLSNQDMLVPGMPVMPLFSDQAICISSYGSHAEGQPVSLDELCALRHVVLNPAAIMTSQKIDTEMKMRGQTRNVVLDVPSFAAVFRAMQQAELIAFIPKYLVPPTQGRLKFLKIDMATPVMQICAIWHPRMTNDAKHQWLREALQHTVKDFLHRQEAST